MTTEHVDSSSDRETGAGNRGAKDAADQPAEVSKSLGKLLEDPIDALCHEPLYALVVGIDDYDKGIGRLEGAVADAGAVATVLGQQSATDPGDPVTLLTNEQATSVGIKQAFYKLKERIKDKPSARVVLYFAGHGVATLAPEDGGETPGFFLPQDAKLGDEKSYLSMANVRAEIDKLGCHHLLLVLDCCFAGAFRWCKTRAASPSPRMLCQERLRRYLRDPAWHVITSAAFDEKALDTIDRKVMIAGTRTQKPEEVKSHGAKSPFALAFVTALAGEADTNPDGVITGSEIHGHVEKLFADWESLENEKSVDAKKRFQRPLFFHWPTREGNKGEFVFLNPRTQLNLARAVELDEKTNPYQGFKSYEYKPRPRVQGSTLPPPVEEPKRFFGRDKLTAELVAMIAAQPIVVVVGASGTGKSSLVCAGALPALDDRWRPLPVVRPGAEPMKALRALARDLDPGAGDEQSLAEVVKGYFEANPGERRVVVIDQLEELETLQHGGDAKEKFFQAVEAAVEASMEAEKPASGHLHVVYTLRSDFEPHFTKDLIDKHPGSRFRITPMSREELCEVIERPAEACVLCFNPPTLVDEIVKEVIDAPGALPLLSFTLSQLYLAYLDAVKTGKRDDRTLTDKDYRDLGRVEGSLTRHADGVYNLANSDPAKGAAMRRVLLRMVTVEGGAPAKRRVLESELEYVDENETARAKAALAALTEARLVVGGEHEGKAFAEPAHDKIVLAWPTLRAWLGEPRERERVDAVRLVRDRADDWSLHGREHGWLDRDARLDRWIELRDGAENPFNALEVALLRGSEELRRSDQVKAEIRAKRMRDSLALAGANLLMRSEEWTAANRLLREVHSPARTSGWRTAACQWLEHSVTSVLLSGAPSQRDVLPVFWWQSENGELARRVCAFSADGRSVVTMSRDLRHVWVWCVESGELRATFPPVEGEEQDHDDEENEKLDEGNADSYVRDASLSADGSYAVIAAGNVAWIWRVADPGAAPVELLGHAGVIHTAAFSSDVTRVVTASADGTARVWDVAGGPALSVLRHEAGVMSAVFDFTGKLIATASSDDRSSVWSTELPAALVASREHGRTIVRVRFVAESSTVLVTLDAHVEVWSRDPEATLPSVPPYRERCGRVLCAEVREDAVIMVTSDMCCDLKLRVDEDSIALNLRNHSGLAPEFAVASADGTRVAAWVGDRSDIQVRTLHGSGKPQLLQGREGPIVQVSFDASGQRVVTRAASGAVRVWTLPAGGPRDVTPKGSPHYSVEFGADGRSIITQDLSTGARISADEGGSRRLDVAERPESEPWKKPGSGVIAWFGTMPTSQEDSFPGAQLESSPDRSSGRDDLESGGDDARAAIDWRNAPPPITAYHERTGSFPASTVSTDGRRVFSVVQDEDGETYREWVWSPRGDDQPLAVPPRASGTADYAVFSHDCSRVFVANSVDGDQNAFVLDVHGREDPISLHGELGEEDIVNVLFSPDGARLVTLSRSNMALLWILDVPALLKQLGAAPDEPLAAAHRVSYLGETEAEARASYDAEVKALQIP